MTMYFLQLFIVDKLHYWLSVSISLVIMVQNKYKNNCLILSCEYCNTVVIDNKY